MCAYYNCVRNASVWNTDQLINRDSPSTRRWPQAQLTILVTSESIVSKKKHQAEVHLCELHKV